MPEKDPGPKKLSMANTKQDMLETYETLLKQLQEKDKAELKPAEEVEKKRKKEIIESTETLSPDGVVKAANELKLELNKTLTKLSDCLQEEVSRYRKVKEAIEIKENELDEIYGIQKAAQSLAALLEAQSRQRQDFEQEMNSRKDDWNVQLETLRSQHQEEKELYENNVKERDSQETKRRQREKEEYDYASKREQQLIRNKFEDEKLKMEKDLQTKKETVDRQLSERERLIAAKEKEFSELEKKAAGFTQETELAVQKAVKETSERLQSASRASEEFLKKSFEGERNVFLARIDSLEKTTKEQKDQIIKLQQQLEKAYQQVESIAVKTVGGALDVKAFASQASWTSEQTKKQTQEK